MYQERQIQSPREHQVVETEPAQQRNPPLIHEPQAQQEMSRQTNEAGDDNILDDRKSQEGGNHDVSRSKELKKETTAFPTNTKGLHTVFIHKLYNMLEDTELKHLMWWTPSNESFVITPGEEFSRALAQYFKHTNVASFVRQLNMYGFHKVSDGNTSSVDADVTIWEFRHSSGNFRKGDINGLKTIKRRSSKHSSVKNHTISTNYDPTGALSDSDFGPETRSSSVVDLAQENSMDPMLNVRLAELGHNLAALRHEHARLQLRYDTAIDDLRKTNLDMVYLLDLLQKLIKSYNDSGNLQQHSQSQAQQKTPSKEQLLSPRPLITQEDVASPGSKLGNSRTDSLQEVEGDIAKFRASIIQRAASKDFDHLSTPFAKLYQMNQQRPSHVAAHPPQPAATVVNGGQSPAAYPYPYPQPQQFPPYPFQHLQQHTMVPGAQQQPQQAPSGVQIVHDPFVNERRRSSQRSRNMSILCDPLQPSAPPSTTSPAASSVNHNSMSGTATDTNVSSPVNNGYFPDYVTYNHQQQQSRVQSPDIQYAGKGLVSPAGSGTGGAARDQRPGSFPGIAPGVQHALRGENFIRKRHSSNDAVDLSSHPPRSVPDDALSIQPSPRKALSSNDVFNRGSVPTDAKNGNGSSALGITGTTANSGVYALLNPSSERRGSVTADQLPTKKSRRI